MKKTLLFFLSIAFIAFASCEKTDSENTPEDKTPTDVTSNYKTASIEHFGFDFSAGIKDTVNQSNNDGETINWHPDQGSSSVTNPSYPSWGEYIWWRNTQLDTINYLNRTKNYGAVDIKTITNIPSSWDSVCMPLIIGQTVVAKCRDGYVKFKVLENDTTKLFGIKVKYLFTTGTTFSE